VSLSSPGRVFVARAQGGTTTLHRLDNLAFYTVLPHVNRTVCGQPCVNSGAIEEDQPAYLHGTAIPETILVRVKPVA